MLLGLRSHRIQGEHFTGDQENAVRGVRAIHRWCHWCIMVSSAERLPKHFKIAVIKLGGWDVLYSVNFCVVLCLSVCYVWAG